MRLLRFLYQDLLTLLGNLNSIFLPGSPVVSTQLDPVHFQPFPKGLLVRCFPKARTVGFVESLCVAAEDLDTQIHRRVERAGSLSRQRRRNPRRNAPRNHETVRRSRDDFLIASPCSPPRTQSAAAARSYSRPRCRRNKARVRMNRIGDPK